VNREFLLNMLFLVFINLLIKPFFIFGIDLRVQNTVPEHEYGLYFTLLSFAYLFQILCDFGIQSFTNRHISRHPQLMPKYFPNLLALKILLSAFYLLIAPLFAWLLFGYGAKEISLLIILLFNQALVQMILFLRSNVSGLGHYRTDSFLSSLDKLLMLFTCGILLWGLPAWIRVETFALAQTAALVLTLILVFGWLRQKITFSIRPSWVKNWRAGRPALWYLFRQSLPYALAILLMTAYTRLDPILLERLLPDGKYHAEVYAGAYRLLDACNMFGYLFASLLLPMFARQLRESPDGADLQPLVSLSFRLIWAASITLAAAVSMSSDHLVELMMPDRVSEYRWHTLGILIWTFVPVGVIYIFSTLLTADEQVQQLNRFFATGIALNVGLNLLLVPHYQATGSAIATLSTQSFIAASALVLSLRRFKWKNMDRLAVRILLFGLIVPWADWQIATRTHWHWQVQFSLMLAVGGAGCVLLFSDYWRRLAVR
jgi:O-antigen/teichoic acid export membrane protein